MRRLIAMVLMLAACGGSDVMPATWSAQGSEVQCPGATVYKRTLDIITPSGTVSTPAVRCHWECAAYASPTEPRIQTHGGEVVIDLLETPTGWDVLFENVWPGCH